MASLLLFLSVLLSVTFCPSFGQLTTSSSRNSHLVNEFQIEHQMEEIITTFQESVDSLHRKLSEKMNDVENDIRQVMQNMTAFINDVTDGNDRLQRHITQTAERVMETCGHGEDLAANILQC
jgi:septation ring formation regulator EzrA